MHRETTGWFDHFPALIVAVAKIVAFDLIHQGGLCLRQLRHELEVVHSLRAKSVSCDLGLDRLDRDEISSELSPTFSIKKLNLRKLPMISDRFSLTQGAWTTSFGWKDLWYPSCLYGLDLDSVFLRKLFLLSVLLSEHFE